LAGGPDGTLDFVTDEDRRMERGFYDSEYAGGDGAANPEPKSVDSLAPVWRDDDAVLIRKTLWSLLGDLEGKTVLLLGNGDSDVELFFLTCNPQRLIVSDLSPVGFPRLRAAYGFDASNEVVTFAAIDALDLPLLDESIDVIYGCALVHHIDDVDRFLAETMRVLRPGGRTVFLDNAYAPAWHWAKQTVLKPLMLHTHRRQPISPEDLRFTMSGGFHIEELERQVRAVGGRAWFRRQGLFYYLWTRAADRLPAARLGRFRDNVAITRALIALDDWLSRFELVRRNLIILYWGLEKPGAAGTETEAAQRQLGAADPEHTVRAGPR
jgi:ubiquinone/menaquinone biosynthesis C-methylase UbiE